MDLEKMDFSKDDEFADPVVRCMACGQLLLMASLKRLGCCHKCGNKRVTNVRTLSGEEMEKLREKGVSENFLKLFEEVPDDDCL